MLDIFVEAACCDILERATSTVDYDQRNVESGHVDPNYAPCCPVLRDLYGGDPKHSEDIVARCFARHGLRLDVQLSYGKLGMEPRFPYVKAEAWVRALDRAGKLDRLIGLRLPGQGDFTALGPSLEEFWQKFKQLHGSHEVFRLADQGLLPLKACVPVYLRGDEGTTYKRDGCLCLSFHSPMGRGTLSNKVGSLTDLGIGFQDDPHTNYVGHTFETRFLLAACLRVIWQHGKFFYCLLAGPYVLATRPLESGSLQRQL